MAVPYEIDLSPQEWESIILNSNFQVGGSIVGYTGRQFQRGYGLGSFFRNLFRIAKPIAKKVFKNVAAEGLTAASSIGSDLLQGRDLKESFQEHGKGAAKRLMKRGINSIAAKRLQQGGSVGYKNKTKGIKTNKKPCIVVRRGRKPLMKSDILGPIL